MTKKAKLPAPAKFQVGDRVRVKQGIRCSLPAGDPGLRSH
jgi:hypothetical protein